MENFDWQIDFWHFDEIIIGDFKECKQQVCDLVVKNKHSLNKYERLLSLSHLNSSAAIICHNDELISSLSWLEIVHLPLTRNIGYMYDVVTTESEYILLTFADVSVFFKQFRIPHLGVGLLWGGLANMEFPGMGHI